MIEVLIGAALLLTSPQDIPLSWSDELTPVQFDVLRGETDLVRFDAEMLQAGRAQLEYALSRRGHVGSRDHIEGCDVGDWAQMRHAEIVRTVVNAASYQDYIGVRDAVLADTRVAASLVQGGSAETLEAEAQRRHARDQALRLHAMSPTEGAAASAIGTERWIAVCAEDLANGPWLDQPAVAEMLATTADMQVISALTTMGLHADHMPWVQDRFAQILFVRHHAGTVPLETAMRLKDAALVNLGRPQMFGMSILCEAGRPAFIGEADMDVVNALRVQLGVHPLDLDALPVADYCG